MKANRPKSLLVAMAASLGLAGVAGCASHPPLAPVANVDLPRFMGPWYVLANIPTFIERDAWNAVESYEMKPDGHIATTFTFNKGSANGPVRRYHPDGKVVPGTGNAVWGMQFVWPIRAEYLIYHLDKDYTRVIIARTARDYLWIMARTPAIPEAELQQLIALAGAAGYDTTRVQRVPQAAPRAVAEGSVP